MSGPRCTLGWRCYRRCCLSVCAQSPRSARADDPKEQPKTQTAKPDFEPIKLSVFPHDVNSADGSPRLIKPGHWSSVVLETKANNFDFLGELEASVKQTDAGNAVDLLQTPYQLQIVRRVVLPKGQPKRLEFPLFVPGDCTRPWLATDLSGRGGVQTALGAEPLSLMRPYQYFLVVLAGEADRYRPLEALDSIRAPHGGDALNYYQVVAPPLKAPLPLPASSLQWSSTAYVIWDDVDPQLLNERQQQALVDWLHQGGELIISGPKSLDQLSGNTFLHDYLPALVGESKKLSAETLAPLNQHWTLPVNKHARKSLAAVTAWNGITLKLQPGAQFVAGTGDLVAQRQVGRGRMVVTSFRLTERELWDWPSFDGFLNGCLLLRPPRKFSATGLMGALTVSWADAAQSVTDPIWVTNVRYLCRDWRLDSKKPDAAESEASEAGIGGWTDFSDVANAARAVLQEAAGIVIPKRDFVTWSLATYLIVLVPLNWLLFWAIRRVEWAWIAAPVIALVSTVVVVRLAQLDIGFARSQTEIDVLEINHDYPRAFLTRYLALYTSLSTNYDVHAAEPGTFILPFSADPDFTMLPGQTSHVVTYQDDPSAVLSSFAVSSNSTGLLHSEEMVDMGGGINYDAIGGELWNQTRFTIERAAAIRRTPEDDYQIAWISDLPSGGRTKLNFHKADPDFEWSLDMSGAGQAGIPRFNFDRLADLVRGKRHLQPGELRLIGLIPQPQPGLTVDPAAAQTARGATLVVASLQEPPLPEPLPDVNSRDDIASGRDNFSSLVPRPSSHPHD